MTHLPRFGAWDGEGVCGHGVLPAAASKEPRLLLPTPLERVVGTGWTWLHALMMTKKKKPGVPLPGTGALRDDLNSLPSCKSATRLCLVKHSPIVSPSSALTLSYNFLGAAFGLVLDPH
jgi:hypothetical protein